MILSPEQYPDSSVYDLLVAAGHGHAGVDRRWVHAIVDRGEAAVPDLVRYGLEDHADDPVNLDDVLVDILYELSSPQTLPLLIGLAREWQGDLPSRLIQIFQSVGPAAVDPLLDLYREAGKGEGSDLGFLLGNLRVRDPRILAELIERLNHDRADGASCLGAYGDPAALPALEAAITGSENWERAIIDSAILHIRSGAQEPPEPHEDIWDEYAAEADPDFEALSSAECREFLASPQAAYRRAALARLAAAEPDGSLFDPVWSIARNDSSAEVRADAWEYLAGAWDRPDIRAALLDKLRDEEAPDVDRAGALAAVAANSQDATLVRHFIDRFEALPSTRARALRAMLNTGDDAYAGRILPRLDDPDPAVLREAIDGAGFFEISEASARLAALFDDEEHRERALMNYALVAPVPNTRRGMRVLLEKIDRLADGLDPDEDLLVKLALNTRLARYEVDPLFSPDGEILDVEAAVATKVGRNDPCPCGSGKKYKKCCGA